MREGHPVNIQGGEPHASTPGITPSATAPPHSISAAMQGLGMHDNIPEAPTHISAPPMPANHPTDEQQDPPAVPNPPAPQPKPKPRSKKRGKQAAAAVADAGDGTEPAVEGTCRNTRASK